MAQTTFPFGKWKDTPIDEVPLDYLAWALGSMKNLRKDTETMIRSSIARRRPGPNGAKAPTQTAPASASSSNYAVVVGIACPACGAMLDVTLTDPAVPF